MHETNAIWLSRQERVKVTAIEYAGEEPRRKPARYVAKSGHGDTVCIDRNDIVLDEEEAMIRELVTLLGEGSRSDRFRRYFVIMRELMDKEVPYAKPLRRHLDGRPLQQLLHLNDASAGTGSDHSRVGAV